MTNKNKNMVRSIAIAACALILPSISAAEELKYNLAGFASIGYGKSLDADPQTSETGKEYKDFNRFTEEGDYRALNILGLRLDANLDDKLAFAAQMVMKGSREYSPRFSWLYAVYNATPNLKIFIGKTAMPLYMYSDFLDAKYAYQWISPPEAVYGGKLLESNTGLQLSWDIDIANDWYTSINAWAGEDVQYIANLGIDVNLDEQAGASWSINNDWFTLRAVYSSAKTSFNQNVNDFFYENVNNGVKQGSEQIAAKLVAAGILPSVAAAGAYRDINKKDITWDGDDKRSSYTGVGISFTFERFYIIAEGVSIDVPEDNFAITDSQGWYIGTGFNITEKWSIHTTYNRSEDGYNEDIAKNYVTENSDYLLASAISENIINKLVRDEQEREMENIALGIRWNFHKSAALKLEYTKAKTTEGTSKERKPDTLAIEADFIF